MFLASTFSSAHKHGDDLSFLIFHKGDLFTEAGPRNYNYKDEMTAYSYSGFAHNVLCVDDKDFPARIGKNGFRGVTKQALRTRITDFSLEGSIKKVTGSQECFPGIVQSRTIEYDKGRKHVIIRDNLEANRKFKASLLFHVAEGVEVRHSDNGGLCFLRDKELIATMTTACQSPVNVKVLTGEGEGAYRTWIFNGKTEPVSSTLVILEVKCGKMTRIDTFVKLH